MTTNGAIITLTSCGGGDSTAPVTPPPPVPVTPTAGLTIVIGAGVSDTIEAQPAQALIVEVRKADGSLSRGTVVRFEAHYLVGRNSDYGLGSGLRLLRVSDGISVLLALGDDYYQPDWR